jgi:glutamyl-Q tRNA(Asp) synthetase
MSQRLVQAVPATRFAPSPTGLLHLGHAYSALCAHDAARLEGGAFRLRIDDNDAGRVRAEYEAALFDELHWLGLIIDGPVIRQSERGPAYRAALDQLREAGLAYPCFCSRSDIAAAVAAPHGPEGPIYPGTCRALDPSQAAARLVAGEAHAWRLDMARGVALAGPLDWQDRDAGTMPAQPAAAGDIVLLRRDGAPAYHLASTIDDADIDITLVVRGLDLFAATHIHRLLQALLGLPTPDYWHHRLIGDAAGRRLAKREDAASLLSLRQGGMAGEALVKMLRGGALPLGFRFVDP